MISSMRRNWMTDPVLSYYNLSPYVVAFSSTRKGGCSKGNYKEFNVNMFCGDEVAHIDANRRALCCLLQIDEDSLVMPHQVHGTVVRRIDEAFLALDKAERMTQLEGVDAVMTDVRQVCVGVSTADCIPVLLYDEAHHAVCAVHAGWRGTVARIVGKAITAMQQAYGTAPEQLKAVIGPGISLESFEVGDEVYNEFASSGFDMQLIARRFPVMSPVAQCPSEYKDDTTPASWHTQEKWHIDLWACNQQQLESAGVDKKNIQVAGICTYKHSDEFFSARKLGIDSGRILTAIQLK